MAGKRAAGEAADDVLFLDDRHYARLAAEAREARARVAAGTPELAAAAAAFLHWEARLLDGRHYRKWLDLLAPDMLYWVPADPSAGDPRTESAINFDDKRRLADRIALIETGVLHAQIPPSRTCRLLGNIEAWPAADGLIILRSNFIVTEYRRGSSIRYVGWQEHRLVDGTAHWLIRSKVINLLDCDEPQGNVTFIL